MLRVWCVRFRFTVEGYLLNSCPGEVGRVGFELRVQGSVFPNSYRESQRLGLGRHAKGLVCKAWGLQSRDRSLGSGFGQVGEDVLKCPPN